MTELYLIRHGQTAWNTKRRFQGHTDIQLDETGRQQAMRLHDRLASVSFEGIYASDLTRARQTAEILAGARPLRIEELASLREIHFGEWEGRGVKDVLQDDPLGRAWRDDPVGTHIPGGETAAAVQKRVQQVLSDLTRRHPQGRVAVVSHGGPIRYMLLGALSLPPSLFWRMDIDNTSISILRWENEHFHLRSVNDSSHLAF